MFCAKSVCVTNYFSSLLTNGFTVAVVTIGEFAKGKGLLVMMHDDNDGDHVYDGDRSSSS